MDSAPPIGASNLERAKVALIYGPAAVSVDYAASLVRGIEAGLRQLGASVSTLNIGLYRREIERIELVRARSGGNDPDDSCMLRDCIAFLNTAPQGKWDYCLGLFHDSYLSDGLMEALRARCRTIINYPLNLLDQPFLFERALQFCDLTFCSEEEAWHALRVQFNDKIRYVPMAADADIHRPLVTPPHPPRLLFVGSFYADRLQLLDRCDRELPTSAYGRGLGVNDVVRSIGRELIRYHRWTPPMTALRLLRRSVTRDRHLILSDEEYVRLASEHGVSIGFSEVRHGQTRELLHKVRLREYEATMCGMCHIARRLPELERGFEDGKEILLYDTFDQAIEMLGRIRRGELDWKGIGSAARRRAQRDHTWAARFRQAFA